MQITLDLPENVVSLLGEHPERAIQRAIKNYLSHPEPSDQTPTLKAGRPITNAVRDIAIADKAVAGIAHAVIANEYNLSIIRVRQIAAQGRAAAYERQQEATQAKIRAIFEQP